MSETVFPQPQNVLDSTVARIASAVENMVPSNVCVNISTSLLPADWSSTAPYIQVWTNNKVTDECAVKVEFPAEAASTNVTYLEFEKVAGGVKFTAPVKPATAIPVIVHIINAEAESITDISADLVSTSAVPNASNVEEGLETLSSDVTALNSNIANLLNLDIGYNSNYTTVQARIQKAIDDSIFTDRKTHIGSLSIGASGMYVLYVYFTGGKCYGSGFAAVSSSHYKLSIDNSTITATLI